MARKNGSKGSAATAVAIAIALVLITVLTCYFFLKRTWWFPEAISADARNVDVQFMRTLWVTGVTFVLSQLALAWVVVRFRNRGQRATYNHGNNTMEILWTSATVIVFVGLGFLARDAWASLHYTPAGPDALEVRVTAQQFAWYFRYPGADGKFGRTAPEFIKDAAGNFVGLDPNDPDGKDDLVLPVINVPQGREVLLTLHTKDVIHSFFVRELRLKQDAVPGLEIPIHFIAEKAGQYEIACAELCGLSHHNMKSFLTVMPPAEYEKWLAEQIAFKAEELAPPDEPQQ